MPEPYHHICRNQPSTWNRWPDIRSHVVINTYDHPIFDGGRTIGKQIHVNGGDLVVWDSRLIHCNSPATVPKKNYGKVDLLRIVAYVSMSPSSLVSQQYTLDEFRLQREEMVKNNRTLTHWCTELILEAVANPLNEQKLSLDKFTAYQWVLIVGTIPDDDDEKK
ncbi:hypothetical protein I4U23_022402 [Adineta vaga]|nr:hypothetical protein I4U23_022402 [Adineta vaga]